MRLILLEAVVGSIAVKLELASKGKCDLRGAGRRGRIHRWNYADLNIVDRRVNKDQGGRTSLPECRGRHHRHTFRGRRADVEVRCVPGTGAS